MQIYVTITLSTPHDQWPMTSQEAAEAVLAALGGDPAVDTCTVQATIPPAFAGVDPTTPLPPQPEPPGTPGTMTVASTFSTQNAPPPGDKQTRTNAASSSAATAVYVDDNATDGSDVSAQLLALVVGDELEVQSVANTTRYMLFTIAAAPIDQGGYVELPVSFVETGGDPANGACTLTFPVRT